MGYGEISHYKEIFHACFYRKIKFIKIKLLESNVQFITNYTEGKSSSFVINTNNNEIPSSILWAQRQTGKRNLGRSDINKLSNVDQSETILQAKPNTIIF